MVKIHQRLVLAIGVVSVAVVLIAMTAYPAYEASAEADYLYALDQQNWVLAEESANNLDAALANAVTVKIDAKGYAFLRVDEETLKQHNSTTSIVIQVQPATENGERKIDVAGFVKVNDATYTITSGRVFLGKERKLVFLNCTGMDESGNQITLKLGARYFWWGGKAFALRSIAVLQTADETMLLLQRGIARTN